MEYADSTPAKVWVHIRESESAAKTVREIQIPISERERPDDYISPDDETSREIIVRAVEEYLDEQVAEALQARFTKRIYAHETHSSGYDADTNPVDTYSDGGVYIDEA